MSIGTATTPRFTAEDLAARPDAKGFELVRGELVERPMGTESSWIGALLISLLVQHCLRNRLGWVFESECGYQCFPDDPGGVRRPDASFVADGRLPGGRLPKGYLKIAPDLAVEVLSPHDLASEVDRKVQQYLAAGVRLVWVVSPETRSVRVHRGDGTISGLAGDQELTGEAVLPGFRCRVEDLFPPRDEPAPPQ
jgi:Uma2 family endonuclease